MLFYQRHCKVTYGSSVKINAFLLLLLLRGWILVSSSSSVFIGALMPQTSSRYDPVTLFRRAGSFNKVQSESEPNQLKVTMMQSPPPIKLSPPDYRVKTTWDAKSQKGENHYSVKNNPSGTENGEEKGRNTCLRCVWPCVIEALLTTLPMSVTADSRLDVKSRGCGECELWLWAGRGTNLNCPSEVRYTWLKEVYGFYRRNAWKWTPPPPPPPL